MAVSPSQPGDAPAWTEDPRYAVSRREMIVTILYFAVYTIAMIGVAWALGGGDSAQEIHYVLGFPAWFFWSTLVLGGVFCIIPYFVIRTFFTDVPLGAESEPTPASGRGEGNGE